jgi:predicted glycosyltransferase
MVREAAVLGIPAFSIFAGATGAIDRYLADRGFLTILHSAAEIDSMPLEKRTRKRRGLECDVNLSSWFADRLITEAEPMTSC